MAWLEITQDELLALVFAALLSYSVDSVGARASVVLMFELKYTCALSNVCIWSTPTWIPTWTLLYCVVLCDRSLLYCMYCV